MGPAGNTLAYLHCQRQRKCNVTLTPEKNEPLKDKFGIFLSKVLSFSFYKKLFIKVSCNGCSW